jgi:hypothetical protein
MNFIKSATYFEWPVLIIHTTHIFATTFAKHNAGYFSGEALSVILFHHSDSESPCYLWRRAHFMSLGGRKGPSPTKNTQNAWSVLSQLPLQWGHGHMTEAQWLRHTSSTLALGVLAQRSRLWEQWASQCVCVCVCAQWQYLALGAYQQNPLGSGQWLGALFWARFFIPFGISADYPISFWQIPFQYKSVRVGFYCWQLNILTDSG